MKTPHDSLWPEIEALLAAYEHGSWHDAIKGIRALITKREKAAVEEAFGRVDAWRVGGIGDLVVLDRSRGHDDVVKEFPRILSEMFPA